MGKRSETKESGPNIRRILAIDVQDLAIGLYSACDFTGDLGS